MAGKRKASTREAEVDKVATRSAPGRAKKQAKLAQAPSPAPSVPSKRGRPAKALKAPSVAASKAPEAACGGATKAEPASASASAKESRLQAQLQAKQKELMERESQLAAAQVVMRSLETQVHQVRLCAISAAAVLCKITFLPLA